MPKITTPHCRKCSTLLTDDNWRACHRVRRNRICSPCNNTVSREFYAANRKRILRQRSERRRTDSDFHEHISGYETAYRRKTYGHGEQTQAKHPGMTAEEWVVQKKEHNEYMRQRREDPEYRAKYNEYFKNYRKKRREAVLAARAAQQDPNG